MINVKATAAELDAKISDWAKKVVKEKGDLLDVILHNAETVSSAEQNLSQYGSAAVVKFRKKTGLSQSMLVKLKQVGLRKPLFEEFKKHLPPSLSSLYALSQLPDANLRELLKNDQSGKTRVELEQLKDNPTEDPMDALISFSVKPNTDAAILMAAVDDFKQAAIRIKASRGIELSVASVAVDTVNWNEINPVGERRMHLNSGKVIFRLCQDDMRKYRKELIASGVSKPSSIEGKFDQRYGAILAEILKSDDPLQYYRKHPNGRVFTTEELAHYELYKKKRIEKSQSARSAQVIPAVPSYLGKGDGNVAVDVHASTPTPLSQDVGESLEKHGSSAMEAMLDEEPTNDESELLQCELDLSNLENDEAENGASEVPSTSDALAEQLWTQLQNEKGDDHGMFR